MRSYDLFLHNLLRFTDNDILHRHETIDFYYFSTPYQLNMHLGAVSEWKEHNQLPANEPPIEVHHEPEKSKPSSVKVKQANDSWLLNYLLNMTKQHKAKHSYGIK